MISIDFPRKCHYHRCKEEKGVRAYRGRHCSSCKWGEGRGCRGRGTLLTDPARVRVQFSNFPDCHSPPRDRSPGIFPRFTGTGCDAMIPPFPYQHFARLFKIPAGAPSSVLKITPVRLVCRDGSCQSTVILPQLAIRPHSLPFVPSADVAVPIFHPTPIGLVSFRFFVSAFTHSIPHTRLQKLQVPGCLDTNITIYLWPRAHFKPSPIPRFKDLRDT